MDTDIDCSAESLSAALAEHHSRGVLADIATAKQHLPPSNDSPAVLLAVRGQRPSAINFDTILLLLEDVQENRLLRVRLIDDNPYARARRVLGDATPALDNTSINSSRRSSRARPAGDGTSFLVDEREVAEVLICPRDVDNEAFKEQTIEQYKISSNSENSSNTWSIGKIELVCKLDARAQWNIRCNNGASHALVEDLSSYVYQCSWNNYPGRGDRTWEVAKNEYVNLGPVLLQRLLQEASTRVSASVSSDDVGAQASHDVAAADDAGEQVGQGVASAAQSRASTGDTAEGAGAQTSDGDAEMPPRESMIDDGSTSPDDEDGAGAQTSDGDVAMSPRESMNDDDFTSPDGQGVAATPSSATTGDTEIYSHPPPAPSRPPQVPLSRKRRKSQIVEAFSARDPVATSDALAVGASVAVARFPFVAERSRSARVEPKPWPKRLGGSSYSNLRVSNLVIEAIALTQNRALGPPSIPDDLLQLVSLPKSNLPCYIFNFSNVNVQHNGPLFTSDAHQKAFSKEQVLSLTNPLCIDLSKYREISSGHIRKADAPPCGGRPGKSKLFMDYDQVVEVFEKNKQSVPVLNLFVAKRFFVLNESTTGSRLADIASIYGLRTHIALQCHLDGIPTEGDQLQEFLTTAYPRQGCARVDLYRILGGLDPAFFGRYCSLAWMQDDEQYGKPSHEKSRNRVSANTSFLPQYCDNERAFFLNLVKEKADGYHTYWSVGRPSSCPRRRNKGTNSSLEIISWTTPSFDTAEKSATFTKIARIRFIVELEKRSTPFVDEDDFDHFLKECSIYAMRALIQKYGSSLEASAATCLKCAEITLHDNYKDGYIHMTHCQSCPGSGKSTISSDSEPDHDSPQYKNIDECISTLAKLKIGGTSQVKDIAVRWENFMMTKNVYSSPADVLVLEFVSDNVQSFATKESYQAFMSWLDTFPPTVSLRCRAHCCDLIDRYSDGLDSASSLGSAT